MPLFFIALFIHYLLAATVTGQRRMWEVMKVSELDCLAWTIGQLYGGR